MAPPPVDYSVYLVTDATPAVLRPGSTVEQVVAAALQSPNDYSSFSQTSQSSIGIVQLRDKTADARQLLATLEALHAHTAAAGAALVINDRVDVAAAAMARGFCEGVHVGQDDLGVDVARSLLGPDAIIGATASTPDEAVAACRAGADYLGLGTVYATATKTNTKHVVGPWGIRRMRAAVAQAGFAHVPAVAIGGIHAGNARRVISLASLDGEQQGRPTTHATSTGQLGVAVVSAIMSAADPAAATTSLAQAVHRARTAGPTDFFRPGPELDVPAKPLPPVLASLVPIIGAVHRTTPLSHNMTNLVVQNFAANVALAVGASPIMSNTGAEAADLARIPGSALVVNMGTVTSESLASYVAAIGAYNAAGRPVIFDPVGAGATLVRRAAVRTILAAGYVDVIKGNEAEIMAVWEAGEAGEADEPPASEEKKEQQRGVDGSKRLDRSASMQLVCRLAARQRCVVVLTGACDYVSDGRKTFSVSHGHPLLGQVTGTGCTLGTVLSATVAAAGTLRAEEEAVTSVTSSSPDTLSAVMAGLVLFERAAELAAEKDTVQGPGTFVPAFLDSLSYCRQEAAKGSRSWIGEEKVFRVSVE